MIRGTWASHVTVLRVFGLELVGTVFSAPAVKVAMNVELSVMFARQTSWRGEEPGPKQGREKREKCESVTVVFLRTYFF